MKSPSGKRGQGLLEFLLVLGVVLIAVLVGAKPFSRSTGEIISQSANYIRVASSAVSGQPMPPPGGDEREQGEPTCRPSEEDCRDRGGGSGFPTGGNQGGNGTGVGSGGGGEGGAGGGGGGAGSGGGGGAGDEGGGAGGGAGSEDGEDEGGGGGFQPPNPILPTPNPGATSPNIPPQQFADALRVVFDVLFNEGPGSLARELADFLVLYQVRLLFEPIADPNVGGFVSLADATTIHLNENLVTRGLQTPEIAAILAHEAFHVTQLTLEKIQARSPVFHLEDVEGPAYVRETLVWDELRRGADGMIMLTSQNELDLRANRFIVSGQTVDIAAHNAYIAQTRGITPQTRLW